MCHFRTLSQDTSQQQCAGAFVLWVRGLGHCSPCSLFRSFASGCVALPVLMNIKAVIEQRQCTGVWSHKDELPVRPGGGEVWAGGSTRKGSRGQKWGSPLRGAPTPRSRSNWA